MANTKPQRTAHGNGDLRPLGPYNSTDVTADLFFRGHRVDRRRLAAIADVLWPNGQLRESPRLPRFYNPAQVNQVELALKLFDFGVELEDLAEALQATGSVTGALMTAIRARHDALDQLAGRAQRIEMEQANPQLPTADAPPPTVARHALSA
jgi:hypothetical protein